MKVLKAELGMWKLTFITDNKNSRTAGSGMGEGLE